MKNKNIQRWLAGFVIGISFLGIILFNSTPLKEYSPGDAIKLQPSVTEQKETIGSENAEKTEQAPINYYELSANILKRERAKSTSNSLDEIFPGIVCWGDSLTAGAGGKGVTYPKILGKLIAANFSNKIPVINCGIGGEDTTTIIGRAGSIPYIISNSFIIPADTTRVKISFTSLNGTSVSPLRQGDCGVNPVIIDGITGNISIDQDSYTSKEYSYYFSRSTAGKTVHVNAGTKIVTSGSISYNNYLPIIFIGQNGGWHSYDELISQQMSIVKSTLRDRDKFLILGLTTGNTTSSSGLETEMLNYYGDRYINLREYLSSEGMYDAGLVPTDQDLEAMKTGSVPPGLLIDKVHLNAYGYTLIGNLVYERMVRLGYFDDMDGMVIKDSK